MAIKGAEAGNPSPQNKKIGMVGSDGNGEYFPTGDFVSHGIIFLIYPPGRQTNVPVLTVGSVGFQSNPIINFYSATSYCTEASRDGEPNPNCARTKSKS